MSKKIISTVIICMILILPDIALSGSSELKKKLLEQATPEQRERAYLIATANIFLTTEAAIRTFKDKYNCLPGDCKKASVYVDKRAINGNGDGKISGIEESLLVWQHLGLAYMIRGKYTGKLQGGKLVPKVNIPSDQADGGFIVEHDEEFGHLLIYASGDELIDAVISPKRAEFIDEKLDDGMPETGSVISFEEDGSSAPCAKNKKYNTSDDSITCMLGYSLNIR